MNSSCLLLTFTGSHPLLAQIPLTVSPFISLPTATTLPYTYKTIPSTLPTSSTNSTAKTADEKPRYVVSSAGHAAHPEEIIASCKSLGAYLEKVKDDADRDLKAWVDGLEARDLAEKRRVAPGWLDSDARILEPEKRDLKSEGKGGESTGGAGGNLMDTDASSAEASGLKGIPAQAGTGVGEELDRAFGGMGL
jgi:hypothetical protein